MNDGKTITGNWRECVPSKGAAAPLSKVLIAVGNARNPIGSYVKNVDISGLWLASL